MMLNLKYVYLNHPILWIVQIMKTKNLKKKFKILIRCNYGNPPIILITVIQVDTQTTSISELRSSLRIFENFRTMIYEFKKS